MYKIEKGLCEMSMSSLRQKSISDFFNKSDLMHACILMFFVHKIKIEFHFQIMHTYMYEVALKYTTPIPIATNRMLQSKIP